MNSKNRRPFLILLIGIVAGLGFAIGFILVKDYFNDTIKTPGDLDDNNIKMLCLGALILRTSV